MDIPRRVSSLGPSRSGPLMDIPKPSAWAIRRTYLDVHEPEPLRNGHTLDYKLGANLVDVPGIQAWGHRGDFTE